MDTYKKPPAGINMDDHETLSGGSHKLEVTVDNEMNKQAKFLFFVPLKYGHMTIGAIEIIATIAQLVNLFFSVRTAVCMLLLYHLPFLYPYFKSIMTKGDDPDTQKRRYMYNTITMGVYSARLAAFTLLGLAFLIYAGQDEDVQQFYCDRYTEVRFNKLYKLRSQTTLSDQDKLVVKEIEDNVASC